MPFPLIIKDLKESEFPDSLEGFRLAKFLGGGTESVYLLENQEQKQLVLKYGAHPDAMKIEILCNAILNSLGVPIPSLAVYDTLPETLQTDFRMKSKNGIFQITEMIEGKANENLSQKTAKEYFLVFALLGNIDAGKSENFITDNEGRTYFIDAGANFLFRSLGETRNESTSDLSDIDSLRDPNKNYAASEWFGSLTNDELKQQAKAIIAKTHILDEIIWKTSKNLNMSDALREQFITTFATRLHKLAERFQIDAKAKLSTPDERKEKMAADLIVSSKVMRELKRKLKTRKTIDPDESPSQPLEANKLTPSELHMKTVLGDRFQANNLAGNVETLLTSNLRKFTEKLTPEQMINLKATCMQFLQNERLNHTTQMQLYHACNSRIAFAYQIYTDLYNLLKARDDKFVFRAKADIFKKFATIADFIAHYTRDERVNNNAEDYNEYAIAANVFLFGNHKTKGSCSFEYFLENSTARPVVLTEMLADLLHPFGINNETIEKLVSIHDRYASVEGGAFYQIGLAKDVAQREVYAADVGGVLKNYQGSLSVPDILDTLLKKETLTSEDIAYVETLQARVLATPTTNPTVNCARVNLLSADDAKTYHAERDRIMTDIAKTVILNTHAANRDYLDPSLTLFRVRESRAQAFDLPAENLANATQDDLAQAILSNNETLLKKLLTHHASWKNVEISFPIKKSYVIDAVPTFNYRTTPDKMQTMAMMLFHSNLPGRTYINIFGEHWWNRLPFEVHTAREIAAIVDKILPLNQQLSFLQQHESKVKQGEIADIVTKLQPADKVVFALSQKEKIKDTNALVAILNVLPAANRFAFACELKDAIKDTLDANKNLNIINILKLLSDEEKSQFVNYLPSSFQYTKTLSDVLEILPSEARLTLAKNMILSIGRERLKEIFDLLSPDQQIAMAHEILELHQNDFLLSVLPLLPENRRTTFVEREIKYMRSDDFAEVLAMLPPSEQLDFAKNNVSKIEDGVVLAKVIPLFALTDQLAFAESAEKAIKSNFDLTCVLEALPVNTRLPFAIKHIDIIDKNWGLKDVLATLTSAEQNTLKEACNICHTTPARVLRARE